MNIYPFLKRIRICMIFLCKIDRFDMSTIKNRLVYSISSHFKSLQNKNKDSYFSSCFIFIKLFFIYINKIYKIYLLKLTRNNFKTANFYYNLNFIKLFYIIIKQFEFLIIHVSINNILYIIVINSTIKCMFDYGFM